MKRGDHMKKFGLCLWLAVLLIEAGGQLELAWADGPYRGKVIDAETKEPIEGAVVVAVWWNEVLKFYSGWPKAETYFADAKEALTDQNGEFEMPGYVVGAVGITKFGIQWPRFFIFKPGYSHYPSLRAKVSPEGHSKTHFRPYSIVGLQRLKIRKERLESFHTAGLYGPGEPELDPDLTNYRRLVNTEEVYLGFEPKGWKGIIESYKECQYKNEQERRTDVYCALTDWKEIIEHYHNQCRQKQDDPFCREEPK